MGTGSVSADAPTLWDGAQVQRDLALEAAKDHSPIGWADIAYAFLEDFLREHTTMHVDQLWAAGMPEPREMRALGPLFRRATQAGIMRRSGQTLPSVRSHLSHKPVWESLIYAGPKW
jgi:hypothetical protein